MKASEAYNFRHKIELAASKLDDTDALEMVELFPQWKEGMSVSIGERYRFNNELYKVIQAHTTQSNWTPDITPALFTKVQINQEQGTIDNPIPYSLNMELIEGKYYLDNNVLYLCTRSLAASYWPLESLIGQYVEVVS